MGNKVMSPADIDYDRLDVGDIIYKVAEAISDDRDLRKLGLQLGITKNSILKAITKNWEGAGPKTTEGNKMMLRKWARTMKPHEIQATLRTALVEAGLAEIADTYLPSTDEHSTSNQRLRTSTLLSEHGADDELSRSQRNPHSSVSRQVSEQDVDDELSRSQRNPLTSVSRQVSEQDVDDELFRSQNNPGSRVSRQFSEQDDELLRSQGNPRSRVSRLPSERDGQTQSTPHTKSAPNKDGESGAQATMPDSVRNMKSKLKTRYRKRYSEVKTSSVDSDSRKLLQKIFVSLVLILKSSLSKYEKTDREMKMEDLYRLIEKESERGFVTRIAFLGDVGVGKSTLFSKIAFDWANDKCLQDIDLLFYEPFQDMEETQSFGNLVMNIFPDITQCEGEEIEKYIQANQRKAAIIMYDLDETKMNSVVQNRKSAVVSIVRGDKFQDTPVLIGTRPFVVDLIENFDSIRQLYTLIEVKGFTREGTRQYIKQFFKGDRESATSLIQFLECNAVASELMAPYPIFCGILCNIWETETKRKAIEQLSSISQILNQVFFSLRELYSWKHRNSERGYTPLMKKTEDAIKTIAPVAFEGLMKDQITFDCGEELPQPRREAAELLHDVGILGKEKKLASREVRLREGKHYNEAFRFPHYLLQEFISSFHLSSMFEDKPSQFREILEGTLLEDWKKYRHVIFFTASKGGEVGKSVMESLCQKIRDVDFIVEVAFECQDEEALDPIKKLLRHKRLLVADLVTDHSFTASLFALETYGKKVIEEVEHRPTENPSETTTTGDQPKATGTYYNDRIVQYTKALFRSPSCRSLLLADSNLENQLFFSTMAAEAETTQIMFLKHKGGRLSPDESAHYANAIVAMPNLQNLELCGVQLSSDEFYPAMAQGASKSRIMSLKHERGSLSPKASAQYAKAIVSMPNLQNLELRDVELSSDKFYPQMADGASQSRV